MLVAESERGSCLVRPRFEDHRTALPDYYANSSIGEVAASWPLRCVRLSGAQSGPSTRQPEPLTIARDARRRQRFLGSLVSELVSMMYWVDVDVVGLGQVGVCGDRGGLAYRTQSWSSSVPMVGTYW